MSESWIASLPAEMEKGVREFKALVGDEEFGRLYRIASACKEVYDVMQELYHERIAGEASPDPQAKAMRAALSMQSERLRRDNAMFAWATGAVETSAAYDAARARFEREQRDETIALKDAQLASLRGDFTHTKAAYDWAMEQREKLLKLAQDMMALLDRTVGS